MRIIGFNLTKILGEKPEKFSAELQINQNIDLKNVTKESIPITKEEMIKLQFSLSINYTNDNGKVEFEGSILILPENDELKEFMEHWKKKALPEKARVPLFNFIMNKCNIKALYLEDELGLPLHVPLPRVTFKKPENK